VLLLVQLSPEIGTSQALGSVVAAIDLVCLASRRCLTGQVVFRSPTGAIAILDVLYPWSPEESGLRLGQRGTSTAADRIEASEDGYTTMLISSTLKIVQNGSTYPGQQRWRTKAVFWT
jgi:hypothetical protein